MGRDSADDRGRGDGPFGAPRRHPIPVGITLILFAGAVVALASVRQLLLVGFLGILVGAVLTWPVDFFSRRLPRGIAVLVTLALFLAFVAALGWLVSPVVTRQLPQLMERMPEGLGRLQRWWWRDVTRAAVGAVPKPGRPAVELSTLASRLLPVAASAVAVAAGVILVIALAFFFAHEPGSYRLAVRSLLPVAWRPIADEAWRRLGRALRHWMAGILVSMTIMGALTWLGLWLAGVDGSPTLGLLTFLGTFVPYAGAIASAIPGLAVALAQSPRRFVYAMIVYVCVHLIEGYVVQPLIMRRAVHLRPAMLLFSQLVLGGLCGVMGVITATPLLACVKVGVEYLYVERVLGQPAAEDRPSGGT